ncbi:MAG: tricarballylate dehydrogenase [Nisaea sp.]|jgi:tricarballylate dehydrogenase|nr:tricarballylate dehydrogenase [Nisaea sp.]OUX92133.1 MAG: tricarballylate dehydrogenase [Candidatus Endolissoclinum sp. TMED26]
MNEDYDVIVVGAGNAAMCAAMSAHEQGAKVVILERAPEDEAGGNSRYTAGAMRFAHNGLQDIATLVDLTDEEIETSDFGTYTTDQYYDDMFRVTQYRTDPQLCETLVTQSLETAQWMRSKGMRFMPMYNRQAFKVDGKMKFWGGLVLEYWGGGHGIWEMQSKIAADLGIPVLFEHRAIELIYDHERVRGVKVKHQGKVQEMFAKSVVLAAGGFESNSDWRTRYLGPGWDLVKVRGTRHNMGEGIKMALDIGAMPYGNWSGCHAVGWDLNAPEFGDLSVGDNFQKHSYPLGLIINAEGKRFVDEGADFRNYTYAKYGREILSQPGQFAWQIFDSKVLPLLRDEYRIRRMTKVQANTLEELVTKLEGVDAEQALRTLKEYNAAVQTDVRFNPAVLDGRGTKGLEVPKSNWANVLDEAPYEAYAITCGVTFTFGGLRIDEHGGVVDTDMQAIPGLYAAGELVGGLFYFNYAGGTGLMSGAVFGRQAGKSAAMAAQMAS